MSKIDDMIKELCPNGVEYKKLWEICEIKRGVRVVKSQLTDNGSYPVYQNSLTPLGYYTQYNYSANRTFIICAGAAGKIGYSEVDFWAADDCFCFDSQDNINQRYLYHTLLANQKYFDSRVRKASIPRLSRSSIENLEIPAPPIEIQQEIVRILDNFTNLTAELQAELQARKEQYEYYRNKLLTFDKDNSDVKWETINQIAINRDKLRKPIVASKRKAGKYPYYGASGIIDYVDSFICEGDYLLISEDGANLIARTTPIAFSIHGKNWVNNHAHIIEFDKDVTRKYVEYYINSIDVSQYITGGAQPKLNQENLNKIPIPIPSLSEQERIVSILDKFEALVNDLSSGLPAEISALQEQYEYYRNKLLTFEKAV